jgi:hypothetical protein
MPDQDGQPAFDESQIVNQEDLGFVRTIADSARQEVIACSIIAHRRPDKLNVGDPVPALDLIDLAKLETMQTVNLASVSARPLVLFFGSYT